MKAASKSKKTRAGSYYTLLIPAGVYQTDNLLSLVFAILKHRTWHLLCGDGWVD